MLQVLVPVDVTDANLTSGATLEDSSAAWNAATNYAIGDFAHRVATHRRYKCAVAGISATPPESDPVKWVDYAPTNKFAMYDGYVSTRTAQASPLVNVIHAGFFNALAILGIQDATGLLVERRDAPGGPVTFTYTDSLEGSMPGDWYDFFFMPFRPKTRVLLTNLEPFWDAELTITLTGPGVVQVGMVAFGDMKPLGLTQRNAKAAFSDYSYIAIDQVTGENKIKKGSAGRDLDLNATVPLDDATGVVDTLEELLGVPAVWVGTDMARFEGLFTFGLGVGAMDYDNPTECKLTVNVKGLI